METAALGCRAEQRSAIAGNGKSVEPCSTGQPRAAVPTWFVDSKMHERDARAHISEQFFLTAEISE